MPPLLQAVLVLAWQPLLFLWLIISPTLMPLSSKPVSAIFSDRRMKVNRSGIVISVPATPPHWVAGVARNSHLVAALVAKYVRHVPVHPKDAPVLGRRSMLNITIGALVLGLTLLV